MNNIKRAVQSLFNMIGFKIVRNPKSPNIDPLWRDFGAGWDTTRLGMQSVKVNAIVDVGVAAGTPSLYKAFPDGPLLLVEPLSLFNKKIITVLAERAKDATIVNCAVGSDKSEECVIKYNPELPMQGSLHGREINAVKNMVEFKVKMRTIDDIVDEHKLPYPYVLKIDVEGNELSAIQGAERTLKNTSILIIEVTLDGSYPSGFGTLRNINAILNRSGFILADLADAVVIGPSDGRLVKKADFIYINPRFDLE